MKKIGIICEYNPFHSGHAYQIASVREREPNAAVVCLMSGHATQRGELAVTDKFTRAAMALSCGADVVLELPYPYCAASAAYFAGAGVAILDALAVDELSFGSECADAALLSRAASLTSSPAFTEKVRLRQRRGEGSAQAYFAELEEALALSNMQFLANDILALEYTRAIRVLESNMSPMPIRREGSAYRATETEQGKHPSATALRECLRHHGINEALKFVPEPSRIWLKNAEKQQSMPTDVERIGSAILAFFRLHSHDSLEQIAEMQGGLANRLCAAARESASYEALLQAAASKSYPTARLRRAILYAMTGVTVQDLQTPPAYLSLLGANEVGRELLREWKMHSPIPIFAKFADAAVIGARQAEMTLALDALFTLSLPQPQPADAWVKHPPCML